MKNFILLTFLIINFWGYGQNIESKIENIISEHIADYQSENKNINVLIIFYEDTFFEKLYEDKNVILLNNRNDIKKMIKKDTYLIHFKTVIENNKLYFYAIHFKVEKNKKGVTMINQMNGNEYYICDLIDKSNNN